MAQLLNNDMQNAQLGHRSAHNGTIHGSLIAATNWIKGSSLLLKKVKKKTTQKRLCLLQLQSCLFLRTSV